MRRLLSFALLALGAAVAAAPLRAQADPLWLRYPALSPDGRTLVFTYKGDLYRVPAAGGAATMLTTHAAQDFMPVWSRDGKTIAFASDRYGNFDVFVIPADGGAAQRLTFHSAPEYPYAFTADGKSVIFGAARGDAASNRQYPTGSQPELYQVAAAGGRPQQLLTTPAEDVHVSRDGRLMLYHDRKGGENAWRKHHVSAIARDLWVFDTQAGTHRQLTTFAGEDRNPLLTPDNKSVVYLSEESGTFNVHRIALTGGASERLTTFRNAPVRFLSAADDGTLAFSQDGQLYTMRAGAAPQRVTVRIAADSKSNAERVLAVSGGVREMTVAPSGKEVAFTFRGDVFVVSAEGGVTKRITSTPEVETGLSFAPDGKALVYASERNGKWGVYEVRRARDAEPYFYAATVLREMPLIVNDKQNYLPRFSPNGRELAWIENRALLRVMDMTSKQTRTVLTENEIFSQNPGQHFEWSPDGQWLLFDYDVPGIAPGEVGLVRADGKSKAINLTESGFNDRGAKWLAGGKAMLWFSNRDGLKAVAQGGGAQSDAYAMFFSRDAWDRFRLTKEEYALVKEQDEQAAKDKRPASDSSKPAPKPAAEAVVLDLDGVDERKARLTIHSSNMGDALVSKDGETLFYLACFERGMNLWSTNLRTRETKQLVALNANSGSMVWDREQKSIFLQADGSIAKIDPASGKRDPVPVNGELLLDADAERQAQFDHVWVKVRDTFYQRGYHGADWAALRTLYQKQLPHVGTNVEFSELLAELLGELNISHSGSSYSASTPTDDATASLGVVFDQRYVGTGVRVAEVLRQGPLDRAGMNVRAGMIIEAIDGVAITPDRDIAQLLNRKAGRNVLLTLADGSTRSDLVAKPISLAEENRLLYTRWVKRNADEVDKLSNGALGYVHIPGMNDGAYRTTFEEVMGRYALRKGLVVDTRFNGGGDLVADLAMFLSGERFFNYTTDTRSNGFEPNFRWTKPSVSLANEANYSDGHCYAFTYKALKLGTLVGMPVPGTCTFAGWESLEGGIRWGVPGVGVKDEATGKFLENWQTEPDLRVANEAAVVSTGKDQQLEAAVAELLKRLPKR
ncbi:S41 family peptidase [Gemmatimonas sp.]|jgi:Tol biopolymer transport system component/C-terminal processing protease CtpA/Prc|uniref:S41 family peptidase n=1 Tax=Gemmatimonas sp. TaxID=1962908 RepID=UPI0037BE8E17